VSARSNRPALEKPQGKPRPTRALVFPFDLFGSGGAGAGASLLAEGLREILADNRQERVPTRARAYSDRLHIREFTFEKIEDYHDWRAQGRRAVREVLDRGEFLLWLTGNHLGALPVYEELAGSSTLVVQLDAHLDIQHFHDHSTEPSHGNFLLHVAGKMPPLINLGNRDLLLPPEHIARTYQRSIPAVEFLRDPAAILAELRAACDRAERILFDLDCDVLDPAYFPAVTRPVPFGLHPQQVLAVLDALWSARVVGLVLAEFDPAGDTNDRCLATLLWLLEWMLLRRYEG
jgi:agmatinase